MQTPKGILADGWDEVVRVICAYAYDFVTEQYESNELSITRLVWERMLEAVGYNSLRKIRAGVKAADWRLRRELRLRTTHWVVAHIIKTVETQLEFADFGEFCVDYTGLGTFFFNAVVRVERVKGKPNKFVVWISSDQRVDGMLEERIAAEHRFDLRK